MNAAVNISVPVLSSRPRFALDSQEKVEIRERLIAARDIGLQNKATLPQGCTRDLNSAMADIANEAAWAADAPVEWLQDALLLCRHLSRDQSIAGQIEGIYPTDRYGHQK